MAQPSIAGCEGKESEGRIAVEDLPISPVLAAGRHMVHVEPSLKRVRAEFGGAVVADSQTPLLVLESKHLPVYYFPFADVRTDFLVESPHRSLCPYKGEARYWHLQVGNRREENAVWAYMDPINNAAALQGHAAFYWNKIDRWLEEDEEVIRHPRDPYHRVDVVRSYRTVEATLGGTVLAHCNSALFLFETGMPVRYYLPKSDIKMDLLVDSPTRTQCPYKGTARYWSAVINGRSWTDVAWSYEDPLPECPRIKGLMSFYSEKLEKLIVKT
jgi:uncharacterized protein (DUF427 family)